MGRWRYLAFRLNGDGTKTLIDPDLPLQGVSLTSVVSGPGAISAKIAPAVARLVGSDGQPVLQRFSTSIFAEESGVIRGGFILDSVIRQPSSETLDLDGFGFSAAPKGQPYDGSTFFIEEEPLTIPRHIWDVWQSRPGGNLGVVLDQTTKTGKKIGTVLDQVEFDTQEGPVSFEAGPFKLNEWETHDLAGVIDDLATDQGFDYEESYRWVDAAKTDIECRIDFGVPRIGTRRDDLRFVVGENVTVPPDETFEADTYASEVLVLGAGEGRTMVRARAIRANETRLRKVAVITDKQIKTIPAAKARAEAALPYYLGHPEISEIVIRDTQRAPLGSWRNGDEVELMTASEWGNESYHVRILSTTITPEDLSVARLSVVRADTMPS